MAPAHCSARGRRPCAALLLLLAGLQAAQAYPSLFANKNAKECLDHPKAGLGAHGDPVPDK